MTARTRTQCRDCTREVMTSSSGAAYAWCEAHVRQALLEAFAPAERVPEWLRRARERGLPAKDYTRD